MLTDVQLRSALKFYLPMVPLVCTMFRPNLLKCLRSIERCLNSDNQGAFYRWKSSIRNYEQLIFNLSYMRPIQLQRETLINQVHTTKIICRVN